MNTANQLVVMPLEEFITLMEGFFDKFLNQRNPPYPSLSEGSKKIYTRKEAAEILKRSPNTISTYIRSGYLHATCLNRQIWISEKAIMDFINQKKKC